jgi:hypothetical protein
MEIIYVYFIIGILLYIMQSNAYENKEFIFPSPKLWFNHPINLEILRIIVKSSITLNVFWQGWGRTLSIDNFKTSGIIIKAGMTTHIPNSNNQVMANHKYHYVNETGKQYFACPTRMENEMCWFINKYFRLTFTEAPQ